MESREIQKPSGQSRLQKDEFCYIVSDIIACPINLNEDNRDEIIDEIIEPFEKKAAEFPAYPLYRIQGKIYAPLSPNTELFMQTDNKPPLYQSYTPLKYSAELGFLNAFTQEDQAKAKAAMIRTGLFDVPTFINRNTHYYVRPVVVFKLTKNIALHGDTKEGLTVHICDLMRNSHELVILLKDKQIPINLKERAEQKNKPQSSFCVTM